MAERFVDRKDKKNLIKNCPDFKLRRHGVPPIIVIYSFISALLAVVILVSYLVIELLFLPDNVTTPNNKILFILLVIGFCITFVAVFATVLIYKIRDIILETEFQNLIFASASRVNTDFCIIVNLDKITVYCDYNFSQLFAAFDNHEEAYFKLLDHEGLKKADKDKLDGALKTGKRISVPMSISKADKTKKYNVEISPISRPSGFCVIKGIQAS